MSDEQSQEQPNENLERDVAELLEQAESLSADLGSEVGAKPPPPSTREKEFFESETDSEASLDLQIAQAESALESAKSDIADVPRPAKKISLPPRKKPDPSPVADEILTEDRPAAGNKKHPPAERVAATVQPAPANRQTARPPTPQGVTLPPARQEKQLDNLVAARIDATPYEFESPQPGRLERLCAKLNLARWAALQEPVVNVVARILETCDRPFLRINRATRTKLGWLSLALTTAALAMWLFMVL